MANLCECNCGQYVKSGKRFIQGHYIRIKNPVSSPKVCEKIGKSRKGKPRPDMIPKMSGKNNPNFGKTGKLNPIFGRKGKDHPAFNRKHTEEELRIISESKKGSKNPNFGKTGKSNPNWKGGSSFLPYPPEFNKELKEYIIKKFNHTCVLCKKYADIPHHVDYDKTNNQEDNFVLLCRSDNGKVNKNRVQWEIYFKLFLLMRG